MNACRQTRRRCRRPMVPPKILALRHEPALRSFTMMRIFFAATEDVCGTTWRAERKRTPGIPDPERLSSGLGGGKRYRVTGSRSHMSQHVFVVSVTSHMSLSRSSIRAGARPVFTRFLCIHLCSHRECLRVAFQFRSLGDDAESYAGGFSLPKKIAVAVESS